MPRVSAFPTVEWLRSLSLPAPKGSFTTRRDNAPERLGRLVESVMLPGVRVEWNTWISTPNGDVDVDVLVCSGERRMAVVMTGAYERDAAGIDALRLVYGRTDVLLRLRGPVTTEALYDVLLAMVVEKPSWFTGIGRVRAGRWATSRAVVTLGTQPVNRCRAGIPFWNLGCHRISRMRMRCASDWVRPFEQELGIPV